MSTKDAICKHTYLHGCLASKMLITEGTNHVFYSTKIYKNRVNQFDF